MTDPDPGFDPTPGVIETLAPGLRRVLAPNPAPMTFRGTNSYILGEGRVAIIDPGPDDPAHLAALLGALAPGETVSHILVTHAHVDHSPLARALSAATKAPVYAYGDALAGRSAVMDDLARAGLAGGGEGVDRKFAPDEPVPDGARIAGDGWAVTALWTPGHFGNHLCFDWDGAVFTGDLVMGWASSMVSPPDGDQTQFMTSCARLTARPARVFHPGHGAPVENPADRLNWLMSHRQSRTAQIMAALGEAPDTPAGLTARIYTDVPPALLPAAERNVFAHLVDLNEKNRVVADPSLNPTAQFSVV